MSRQNIANTIEVLLENNYIPIINENDTVATEEIQFGDNDKLAALTGRLLEVDLVIVATNTFGIYTRDSFDAEEKSTIERVQDLDALKKEVMQSKSSRGTGGMKSKIEAAEILKRAHIETWIVNGIIDNFMVRAMNEQVPFTRIPNS